jgi:transposase
VSTKSVIDTGLSGRQSNRSWPAALKREIVEAALAPGASVSVVARRYDVNANQVFGWRKRYRDGSLAPVDAAAALMMVPVTVTADEEGAVVPGAADTTIEIELADKYRVRGGLGRMRTKQPDLRSVPTPGFACDCFRRWLSGGRH